MLLFWSQNKENNYKISISPESRHQKKSNIVTIGEQNYFSKSVQGDFDQSENIFKKTIDNHLLRTLLLLTEDSRN